MHILLSHLQVGHFHLASDELELLDPAVLLVKHERLLERLIEETLKFEGDLVRKLIVLDDYLPQIFNF